MGELQIEFYRCMFECVQLQYWEKNDIMLFDNILYGHFRMPGTKPRKLHAMFFNEINTRILHRKDAPVCVVNAVHDEVDGSIDGVLSQLGAGGNIFVLWFTTYLLPDWFFYLLGILTW